MSTTKPYQPKTGQRCHCKRGQQRDNCPDCEGTGWSIDFGKIRARNLNPPALREALLRLLIAAEGLDPLYDDDSRAETYAAELRELSEAKDTARIALGIGVPPREVERANHKATEAL